MHIRFLGHACLLLTADDHTTLLIDPYNPGGFDGKMAHAPIPYRADFVVCTHDHLDHSAIHDLPTPHPQQIFDGPAGPFQIHRFQAEHDEHGGRHRGGFVDIIRLTADNLRLVHLSDVGHSPTADLLDAIGPVDILFVPTGGFFTIGAAQAHEWCQRTGARLILPIHYQNARCTLPLLPLEIFSAHGFPQRLHPHSDIAINHDLLSFEQQVVVLEPQL